MAKPAARFAEDMPFQFIDYIEEHLIDRNMDIMVFSSKNIDADFVAAFLGLSQEVWGKKWKNLKAEYKIHAQAFGLSGA